MDRSTGQHHSAAGGLKAYYVAVSRADAKLDTLVELLEALKAGTSLAVVITCSSRDSLDSVVAALAQCEGFSVAVLHGDMQLHDLEQQVAQLKRALYSAAADCPGVGPQHVTFADQQQQQHNTLYQPHLQVNQQQLPHLLADHQRVDRRSFALVTTDVCLKALPKELLPIGARLLIQYDLSSSKDILQRRLGCVFGSSKERSRRGGRLVVIDFVMAGQVAAFRRRERMSSLLVQEMPVHAPDVFA